jgi:gluconokinase
VTVVILMGVSGAGKSTIAAELKRLTGWPFAEADSFHSAANVAKMRSGHPLTDADRAPWLDALSAWIDAREAARESAIMTCSALHRTYRDRLREGHPTVVFVSLAVPADELARRLAQRRGHYMPMSLLPSQLAAFQPLTDDEPGFVVQATGPPPDIAAAILRALKTVSP